MYAGRVPWRAKCLEQALAAKMMLRRRKIANELYLGVKQEENKMLAHAWLQCEKPEGYVRLACFEDRWERQ